MHLVAPSQQWLHSKTTTLEEAATETGSCSAPLTPCELLGECGALWGERERVVSCIYRQHGSYVHVYTACFQCILRTTHNRIFIQIYASALWVERTVGRAPSPISLRFVNLSCLCLAVSAPCRTLSLSFSCAQCSLFSLSSNGFRAVLEVFRIYMFTASSKTTIKSDFKSVRTCSQLDHTHSVRTRHAYACR